MTVHDITNHPTVEQYWGYGPVVKKIQELTGIEFELWHTGGNCWLLTGMTETGHVINIGDNDGPLYPLSDHHEGQRMGYEMTGWSLTVSVDDEHSLYGEYVLEASVSEADERLLPGLVIDALRALC